MADNPGRAAALALAGLDARAAACRAAGPIGSAPPAWLPTPWPAAWFELPGGSGPGVEVDRSVLEAYRVSA